MYHRPLVRDNPPQIADNRPFVPDNPRLVPDNRLFVPEGVHRRPGLLVGGAWRTGGPGDPHLGPAAESFDPAVRPAPAASLLPSRASLLPSRASLLASRAARWHPLDGDARGRSVVLLLGRGTLDGCRPLPQLGRRALCVALPGVGGVADARGNAPLSLLADVLQLVTHGVVVHVGRAAEDDVMGFRGVCLGTDGLGRTAVDVDPDVAEVLTVVVALHPAPDVRLQRTARGPRH